MVNMSRCLVFLLTLLVTMTTLVEGSTLSHETGEESHIHILQLHRPVHFNDNTRTFRLQRPSISEPMGLTTNLLQADHFKRSWHRNVLPQQNRIVHTSYPMRERFQLRRNNLRDKIVRPYRQPVHRRWSGFPQRNSHFDALRHNALSTYSLDDSLQAKSSVFKHNEIPSYSGTRLHANNDKTAVPGDVPKRTSGRNLRINLNLNRNGSRKRHVISVKSKDIRNIRLSHLSGNAIIDLHKGGRRTRITYSRKQQQHPVKAEVVNSVVPDTPVEAKLAITTQSLPPTTATTPAIIAGINLNETISVTNDVADQQTTSGVDTNFYNTQTISNIPSEILGVTQSHTVVENVTSSTLSSKFITNDNYVVTTVGQIHDATHDVTTEEPDVPDIPDVDTIGQTGSSFRSQLYSDIDYD